MKVERRQRCVSGQPEGTVGAVLPLSPFRGSLRSL